MATEPYGRQVVTSGSVAFTVAEFLMVQAA